MRKAIAFLVAALSLAALPALVLADAPAATSRDCTKVCGECARPSATAASPASSPQEPSDFVKSIWTSA